MGHHADKVPLLSRWRDLFMRDYGDCVVHCEKSTAADGIYF
jgi:hypothetical protein